MPRGKESTLVDLPDYNDQGQYIHQKGINDTDDGSRKLEMYSASRISVVGLKAILTR